jgi:hypothetical protein
VTDHGCMNRPSLCICRGVRGDAVPGAFLPRSYAPNGGAAGVVRFVGAYRSLRCCASDNPPAGPLHQSQPKVRVVSSQHASGQFLVTPFELSRLTAVARSARSSIPVGRIAGAVLFAVWLPQDAART